MKRLLALDGGGIRGVFSLEILARIETLLREKSGNPNLVLADYIHYFGGTSTGAIIATCLSWGMSVADVRDLYTKRAIEMFRLAPLYLRFWNKFEGEAITRMFKTLFSEDGEVAIIKLSERGTVRIAVKIVRATAAAEKIQKLHVKMRSAVASRRLRRRKYSIWSSTRFVR